MRQHFTSQELADHFTLLPEDAELLAQKTGVNRLGCAILLKCLQWEGRFPTTWYDVPREVIHHMAQAVGIPFGRHHEYDLDGRLARYHKDQIRQSTGFRPGMTADADGITAWVCANTRVDEATAPHLMTQITERYKELKIELPTTLRLERLAHSAVQTIEEQFFIALSQALPLDTRQMIDAMLTDSPNAFSLTTLKADSGRRTLNSLEAEIEKLRQLKRLELPDDVFAPLSSRYLRRMKLRVSAETLHELRRHPDPIRYALVALFGYVLTQEITDRLTELLLRSFLLLLPQREAATGTDVWLGSVGRAHF